MKKNFQIFLIHLLVFAIGTVFYISLFSTPLFSNMSVLFYRGIALLLVASTLTALLIWIIGLKLADKLIIGRDVILAFTLMFSTNIMFFTHFPVTADRSVTVFLLGYMYNHSDVEPVMTKAELQNIFIDKYVKEYDAMDRRMHEQIVTGTIEKTADGNYRLTQKGKLFVKFNVWIGNYYGLDEKNINPK